MQFLSRSNKFSGVKQFQVLGERCSGTNYAKSFFEKNFYISHVESLGWKHGFPTFTAFPKDFLAVVVFRNAHSWVRSMYGKPWHTENYIRKMNFHDFIRAEWNTFVDKAGYFRLPEGDAMVGQTLQLDRHPITGRSFRNIVEMRNAKTQAWLGLANRNINVFYVNHEKLVADPKGIIDMVSNGFDMVAGKDILIPEGKFGWNWPKRVTSHPMPTLPLDEADQDFINSNLDMVQERAIGYSYY